MNFVIAQVEKKLADVPVDLYLKYVEFIYSDNARCKIMNTSKWLLFNVLLREQFSAPPHVCFAQLHHGENQFDEMMSALY